jgi:hypothetical protein
MKYRVIDISNWTDTVEIVTHLDLEMNAIKQTCEARTRLVITGPADHP